MLDLLSKETRGCEQTIVYKNGARNGATSHGEPVAGDNARPGRARNGESFPRGAENYPEGASFFSQKEKIMKAETPITSEDSRELFGLSAVFIGLGILIHRLFFLVALIFAVLAATKQLLTQTAGSIFHRRFLLKSNQPA